jgi:hypothetical protein
MGVFPALPGVWTYAHTPRDQWILDCLGMVTQAGSQVWWTWETEDSFRRVKEGDKHAMKTYTSKLTNQLSQLTKMVSKVMLSSTHAGVVHSASKVLPYHWFLACITHA